MSKNSAFDGSGQTHMFTSFPDSHQDPEEELNLLENEIDVNNEYQSSPNQPNDEFANADKKYSVWQIEYYQKYFNVDTSDVTSRIIASMVPSLTQNYLITKIRPNPDLYGPFWISTTLIFTIAIAGNIISFFHNFGTAYNWQTDFHKVTSSAAAIFAYCWLVPLILYVIIRWRKNRADYEFVEILCVYGYSLSIYIPVAMLWLIDVVWLQWLLVLIAVALSGSVLITTFWPVFSEDGNKKLAIGTMVLIILLHALLGIGFMMYFFHYPTPANMTSTTTMSTITSHQTNSTDLIQNSTQSG